MVTRNALWAIKIENFLLFIIQYLKKALYISIENIKICQLSYKTLCQLALRMVIPEF